MYTLALAGIKCEVIMLPDLIQTVDVLTPEQVKYILNLLDPDWYEPTTVFGLNGCEVNENIRTNSRICLQDDHIAARIMHDGMNRALLKYREEIGHIQETFLMFPTPGSYRTNSYREMIQVLRYQPGEFYKWHTDAGTDKDGDEYHRTISIVLYLTDDFEGGRTEFPHTSYKPKAGQALIFPSNWCFPHQAQPVISGEKIAAVTWYSCFYNYDQEN